MRTFALRSAGICPPQRRADMAKAAGSAGAWNVWLWAWIASEDLARAHRELLERFRPDLLPLAKGLEGHASLLSNDKLRRTVGWQPQTSWRALRGES